MNRVFLDGFLTYELSPGTTSGGTKFVTITIANHESVTHHKTKKTHDKVTFVCCFAYGAVATKVIQSGARKGAYVIVEAKLVTTNHNGTNALALDVKDITLPGLTFDYEISPNDMQESEPF